MSAPFFKRLQEYYGNLAKVLRGEAATASIFPNPSDIGLSREKVYAKFLQEHCPSKCNVIFGGFVFDENGSESGQMDIIVTTDSCPQFNFHNSDGSGKAFSCVEGTLACVSLKSTLDKNQLFDSLEKFATIPTMQPLGERVSFYKIKDYEDWPYKIIYASKGLKVETITQHLNDYYSQNPTIPYHRRPNLIHVAGQYLILRICGDELFNGMMPEIGTFFPQTNNPDILGITWVIDSIQQHALSASYILFKYQFLINKIL